MKDFASFLIVVAITISLGFDIRNDIYGQPARPAEPPKTVISILLKWTLMSIVVLIYLWAERVL